MSPPRWSPFDPAHPNEPTGNPVFAAPRNTRIPPRLRPGHRFPPTVTPCDCRATQTRRDSTDPRSSDQPAERPPSARHPATLRGTRTRPARPRFRPGRRAFGASRTCARSKLLAASDPPPDSRGRVPRHPTGPTSCPQSALALRGPLIGPRSRRLWTTLQPSLLETVPTALRSPPPCNPPHRMHLRCTKTPPVGAETLRRSELTGLRSVDCGPLCSCYTAVPQGDALCTGKRPQKSVRGTTSPATEPPTATPSRCQSDEPPRS